MLLEDLIRCRQLSLRRSPVRGISIPTWRFCNSVTADTGASFENACGRRHSVRQVFLTKWRRRADDDPLQQRERSGAANWRRSINRGQGSARNVEEWISAYSLQRQDTCGQRVAEAKPHQRDRNS